MPRQPYDVAIVGSGPLGTAAASVLVKAGLRVVMLEGGDPPDANRYHVMEEAMQEDIAWKFEPWRYETEGDDLRLNTFAVRKLGGSSVAWGAVTPRFLENDFRMKSRYGVGEDWPLSYEDLEPHYGKAEWFMGVSGAAGDSFNGPRSHPFPMPGFPMGETDLFVKEACEKIGIEVHSVPSARNSVPFRGRSRCINYAICRACPNGALFSSDYIVRDLLHEPNFELLTGAHVQRVELGADGKVGAFVYRRSASAPEQRVEAGHFIMATQGVEIVRLLLNSASDAFPDGVANRSGVLGKYLTEHVKFYYEGQVAERLDPHLRGYETATSLQFHDHEKRGRFGGGRLLIRENGGPSPSDIARESGLWGGELRDEVRETFGKFVTLGAFMEQLPYEENRIRLSDSMTDEFGQPAARIEFKLMKAYEKRGFREMTRLIRRVFKAMGGWNVRLVLPPSVSGHYMSCHRMGRDSRTSVVDADLKSHDVDNLYLASIGAFPTGGISNPTLTGVALAIRMAERIAEKEAAVALVS